METYKANSRNISHLEEAIQLAREAIRECPHDETNHLAGRKMTLAANLSLLCEATKEERHLDEAIRYNNEAVRSTKEGDPMRSARLCTLGNTIGKKYNRTNDIKDLEESLEYNREAKRLIRNSTDQAKRINIINSYSVRLLWHFERCGDRESLDESLARMQELVDTTPQDHPMWNQLTSNLCNRLITRYEVGNEQRDFHDAIERAEEAISRCSSMRNIVDKALTLYTLCLTIGARYRTTGALTDLTAAVEYAKQAVRLIPPEHIEYASVLQSKSLTLLMLYERHENPSDLDEAIRSGEDSATVVIHRDRQAMIYTNLGTLYGHRWMLGDKTNDKDLEMAITYCRRRLGLQLREPGGLVNLANWLLATQKRDVLDEAIALAEEAFGMMVEVPDHPDRARVAHTLAKAWESRYRSRGQESDGGAEDRRRAKEVMGAVMARATSKSPPADRIQLVLSLAYHRLVRGRLDGGVRGRRRCRRVAAPTQPPLHQAERPAARAATIRRTRRAGGRCRPRSRPRRSRGAEAPRVWPVRHLSTPFLCWSLARHSRRPGPEVRGPERQAPRIFSLRSNPPRCWWGSNGAPSLSSTSHSDATYS
ncbi:uncharacterized protein EKO05_0002023 [Ascochyta rabiei]|uniref:uncharacterized protein n=1 Tax=Didymella rabiei TaxID=5454 RepID=UPI0021F96FFA|nr:uncharacterized protein EKO05_0002023 [Ascochyta rabiei]UPX11417.1 hypothetical protein EKO05_0002023 [Ascochyta rabiei]